MPRFTLTSKFVLKRDSQTITDSLFIAAAYNLSNLNLSERFLCNRY